VVTRGDVCWAEFPEEGRRPVLVLTRDVAIPVLHRLTVVSLTRTIRGIPTEVVLGADDGMPHECVVNLDNVRQARHSQLGDRITSLSGPKMHEVCDALAIATGCR
jgi:mRNA interferase MazF